jgi:hypothetical protein
MDMVLLIAVIVAGVALLLRPTPQAPIVYIPVEMAEPAQDGLGCLPLLILGVIALLVLAAQGGA